MAPTRSFARYGPIDHRETFFEPQEYARRLDAVRRRLEAAQLDLLVTFGPANVTYLSGHASANIMDYHCLLVPVDGDPVLVLWYFELGRFHASAVGTTPEAYDTGEAPVPFTVDVLRKRGWLGRRIGIDGGKASVPAATLGRLVDALSPKPPLVAGIVEAVRLVKSAPEVELLRRSARLTAAGVEAAVRAIRPGARDYEVAGEAHRALMAGGGQYFSSQPYVCAGWRGGTPHSNAGGETITPGTVVFLEMGGVVGRYTAPIMRTACLGDPGPEVLALARVSKDALAAVMEAMRPGVPASSVARAGAEVTRRLPEGTIFHYTFGYPVGLGHPPTWAEEPSFLILRDNHEPLAPGMVFHLPMSMRAYGRFGVAFSETVHVADRGLDVLTGEIPRELFVVPAGSV